MYWYALRSAFHLVHFTITKPHTDLHKNSSLQNAQLINATKKKNRLICMVTLFINKPLKRGSVLTKIHLNTFIHLIAFFCPDALGLPLNNIFTAFITGNRKDNNHFLSWLIKLLWRCCFYRRGRYLSVLLFSFKTRDTDIRVDSFEGCEYSSGILFVLTLCTILLVF